MVAESFESSTVSLSDAANCRARDVRESDTVLDRGDRLVPPLQPKGPDRAAFVDSLRSDFVD